MDRWDLQIGQRRPLDTLVLVHTGVVLAFNWSPPSSSPATRRVELPEENRGACAVNAEVSANSSSYSFR